MIEKEGGIREGGVRIGSRRGGGKEKINKLVNNKN